MSTRLILSLGILGWLVAGCGGTDSTVLDAGNDATTGDANNGDSGPNNDSGKMNDGAANDSSPGGDSGADSGGDSGSTLFPCLVATCDSATQYCHIQEVGPQPADGGIVGVGSCVTYPVTCGNSPSCSCIPTSVMCACTESGSRITDTGGGV